MQKPVINNDLARHTWEEIGSWWDEQMVEGDIMHSHLIHPYVMEQLALKPDDQVIDLACGNGALTRRIAKAVGNHVWGVDFSSSLLAGAKKRDAIARLNNHYEQIDLMNEESLSKLETGQFNKAVCSMALQDIENIAPLVKTVKRILPTGGCFVVSLPHPCFNSGIIGLQLDNKNHPDKRGVVRDTYIHPVNFLSYGKEDQPRPHPFFHRPLSLLLTTFFQSGFVLDRCDEPVFSNNEIEKIGMDFLWCKLPEISPVMIMRFITRE